MEEKWYCGIQRRNYEGRGVQYPNFFKSLIDLLPNAKNFPFILGPNNVGYFAILKS